MSNRPGDLSLAGNVLPIVRWAPFALMVFVFLLYYPTLHYEFLDWDDYVNITQHARFIRLNWSDVLWLMRDSPLGDYKPAVWLSYGLDRWIWGFRPEGYRLTNILLHCVNAWLVYLLGVRLAGKLGVNATHSWIPAVLAASLFAVHPQRVESVVWISERKDVLYAFFYLAATYLYLDMPEVNRPFRRLLLIYVLGALAMLSKSAAVTLPLTLLLFVFLPSSAPALDFKATFRRLAARSMEMAPLFICALLIGLRAIQDHHPDSSVAAPVDQDPSIAMMITRSPWVYGQAMVFNVIRTFVPMHLSPLYPGWSHPAFYERMVLIMLGVISVAGVLLLWRRGMVWAMICIGWFVLSIFPSLPIRYPADRYTYVPAIGLVALAVAGWWLCFERGRRRGIRVGLLVLAIATVGCSAIASLRYFPVWRDSLSLWERAVQYSPGSKAYSGLAVAQMRAMLLEEAEQTILKSLALTPRFARSHSVLGEIYMRQGRREEAKNALEQALSLRSDLVVAWLNLGTAHAIDGSLEEAVRCWRRGFDLDPMNITAALNLGRAMVLQGRVEDARFYYERAMEIKPNSEDARAALATLHGGPRS